MSNRRFPDFIPHWERAIGAELQLLRSQAGLTRLAAGRPVSLAQRDAADGYLDVLQRLKRAEISLLDANTKKLDRARKQAENSQERYHVLAMRAAKLDTFREIRKRLASTEVNKNVVAELDGYLEALVAAVEGVSEVAVDASKAQHKLDYYQWLVERLQTRASVIQREIDTVLGTAVFAEHLPEE